MRMIGDPTLEGVIESLTKDRLNEMTVDSGN